MEGLPKDMRTYIVRRFLMLGSLRNLLCVSKSYYMMFKFYVRIQTIPFGGSYTPPPCGVCNSNQQTWVIFQRDTSDNEILPKRSLDHLVPKNGLVECERGHRFLCHGKDDAYKGRCRKCKSTLKKIKI